MQQMSQMQLKDWEIFCDACQSATHATGGVSFGLEDGTCRECMYAECPTCGADLERIIETE
jgi:hypothetical protein